MIKHFRHTFIYSICLHAQGMTTETVTLHESFISEPYARSYSWSHKSQHMHMQFRTYPYAVRYLSYRLGMNTSSMLWHHSPSTIQIVRGHTSAYKQKLSHHNKHTFVVFLLRWTLFWHPSCGQEFKTVPTSWSALKKKYWDKELPTK